MRSTMAGRAPGTAAGTFVFTCARLPKVPTVPARAAARKAVHRFDVMRPKGIRRGDVQTGRLRSPRWMDGLRLKRPPGGPHRFHHATEPRLMPKAPEERLVLREPWRVDEPEFHGALEEVDRRVSL